MQIVSDLHVYSGFKFMTHNKLQIGHICPDEILDLELDNTAHDDGFYSINDSGTQMMHTSINEIVANKAPPANIHDSLK